MTATASTAEPAATSAAEAFRNIRKVIANTPEAVTRSIPQGEFVRLRQEGIHAALEDKKRRG